MGRGRRGRCIKCGKTLDWLDPRVRMRLSSSRWKRVEETVDGKTFGVWREHSCQLVSGTLCPECGADAEALMNDWLED